MIDMLLVDVTMIVGAVILAAALISAIFVGIKLNKKVTYDSQKIDWNKFKGNGQLKKHTPLLWPKELEFYYMFRTVLPKEFMIIPKLGVDEIVKPDGGKTLFNAVKDEHVNMCIVKVSNMEPVAVLDTYYPSIGDSTIQELPVAVKKALESVDIPVIKYEILDVPYDKDAVLKKFLNAIDPITLAQLKNKK